MQPNTYFEQEQIIWFLKILPLVEQKRSKAKKICHAGYLSEMC